jgi:pyruvate/2-oxoglutarate dehydrogenase complex dihydrolipoamide acyltransferase (E2) component
VALLDPDETIIPLRGAQGMIAEAMHRSLADTAQLTHMAECDASNLFAAKTTLKAKGIDVSIQDLIILATLRSLSRHPAMNGRVEGKEIRLSRAVHMGIAIALADDTLVAPALFDADRKSLAELASARQELVARARAGKLTVKEMTGGTFTVTNLGLSRVRFFTPILNPPQIAILGVGAAGLRPWASEDGKIAARPIIGLSLTFDHRGVNGLPAARFLTDLCRSIDAFDSDLR